MNIFCLVGSTGVGKTGASLALHSHLPLSIINIDSRQVYKDFPIITAQASLEEQKTCPHFLYGFLDSEKKISAGEYVRKVQETVPKARQKSNNICFVGGTGLYVRSLFEGIAAIPPISPEISARWIQQCELMGSSFLYKQVQEIDPLYAKKIHPHDKQRICRSLEVWEQTGKNLSWWHKEAQTKAALSCHKVGLFLPLRELEPFLRQRIEEMIENGAIAEAENAYSLCNNENAPAWTSIGSYELLQYMKGNMSLEQAKELWYKNTRAYAKRQITWFKQDASIRWFSPYEREQLIEYVLKVAQD